MDIKLGSPAYTPKEPLHLEFIYIVRLIKLKLIGELTFGGVATLYRLML